MGTMATMMLIASVGFGLANRSMIEKLSSMRELVLRVAALIMIAIGLVIIYLDLDTATFRKLFFAFPIR